MWVSARLHHIVSTFWVMRRYMSLDWLNEKDYGGSAYCLRNIVPKKARKISDDLYKICGQIFN